MLCLFGFYTLFSAGTLGLIDYGCVDAFAGCRACRFHNRCFRGGRVGKVCMAGISCACIIRPCLGIAGFFAAAPSEIFKLPFMAYGFYRQATEFIFPSCSVRSFFGCYRGRIFRSNGFLAARRIVPGFHVRIYPHFVFVVSCAVIIRLCNILVGNRYVPPGEFIEAPIVAGRCTNLDEAR